MSETTKTTPREQRPGEVAYRLCVLFAVDREPGEVRVLGEEALQLGRSTSEHGLTSFVIDHPEVSRAHALLEPQPARGFALRDLGSHNGTFVNGIRVSHAQLAHGDVVRVGSQVMLFQVLAAEDCKRLLMPQRWPADALLGSGPSILRVREAISRAAGGTAPVLVRGESGVGKELVAASIHARSARKGEFVAVNCAALPHALAESELFGHVRGAFTGATQASAGLFRAADGGTLLLDEIGDMTLELQAKLLRVLAQNEVRAVGATAAQRVDVKVVAATHVPLDSAVEQGRFRGDLYARLLGVAVDVPPLRERREDILELTRYFSKRAGPVLEIDADAAQALLVYGWPFNVRELEQCVALAATSGDGRALRLADLPERIRARELAPPADEPSLPQIAAGQAPSKDQLELLARHYAGNVKRIAAHLQRDRREVYRWSERHGIDLDAFRTDPRK